MEKDRHSAFHSHVISRITRYQILKFLLEENILFQDETYLVVNKPAGLSSLNDRNDPSNLLEQVRTRFPEATLAHRLDKETSGALIVALSDEAYRSIAMQFEDRTVKKVYHAVVDGTPNYNYQEVDAPIERMNDGSVRVSGRGKPSLTYLNTLDNFKRHSLVAAMPVTGRTHQIRIHLSMLGTPITGDLLYGGKPFLLSSLKRGYKTAKEGEERPLIGRLALHAKKIEFQGLNGHPIRAEAPYPKDFKALLNQLERFKS